MFSLGDIHFSDFEEKRKFWQNFICNEQNTSELSIEKVNEPKHICFDHKLLKLLFFLPEFFQDIESPEFFQDVERKSLD